MIYFSTNQIVQCNNPNLANLWHNIFRMSIQFVTGRLPSPSMSVIFIIRILHARALSTRPHNAVTRFKFRFEAQLRHLQIISADRDRFTYSCTWFIYFHNIIEFIRRRCWISKKYKFDLYYHFFYSMLFYFFFRTSFLVIMFCISVLQLVAWWPLWIITRFLWGLLIWFSFIGPYTEYVSNIFSVVLFWCYIVTSKTFHFD